MSRAFSSSHGQSHQPIASQRPPVTPLISHSNQLYDRRMFTRTAEERYGGSDFHNLGYWGPATRSRREACRTLMERIVGLIPERLRHKNGVCLDVGCGKGASTRFLTKFYRPENLTGINVSEKQIERCRQNAPRCQFFLMDATHLDFPDDKFDVVVCVEAAFHFNTRDDFLREARRVLKPGGRLVLTDILVTRRHEKLAKTRLLANYIPNPRRYSARLEAIGFENIQVVDATTQCAIRCLEHLLSDSGQELTRGKISRETFRRRRSVICRKLNRTRYYVLAAASRPA